MSATPVVEPRETAGASPASAEQAGRFPFARLILVTLGALAVHGYHLGVEDGEIYIPAIRKLLHPRALSYGSEFFLCHERLSLFAPIVAWSARLTHLSADWAVFLWYVLTLFATFAACWTMASICFKSSRARWSAVLLIASALTMPAANTGLLLMDPYLTARSFSTPLTLFALAALVRRRYWLAALLTAVTAAIHPQMAAYLVFLAVVLSLIDRWRPSYREQAAGQQPGAAAFLLLLPVGFHSAFARGFHLGPATGPYREALYARNFFFLSTWTWYHWIGLVAPLAFLAWF